MRFILGSAIAVVFLMNSITVLAQKSSENLKSVQSSAFLGQDWMAGPFHTVHPYALSEGHMLVYKISSQDEVYDIKGTAAARDMIREITATGTLRQRSTAGTIVESAAGRTLNIVETPIRVVSGLVKKADDISSFEEGVLFIPTEIVNATGQLIDGVGELAVTGVRITTGAASTKCSGLGCVEKAGEDIWSGFNSLMGKHNSARRLHNEFGTDPQTQNKTYRKQIDRLAYAESYTATTVKLGVSNAGIEYLSPAMQTVGWYNNGEFVAGYEDAHRRRNFEKKTYAEWGADSDMVAALYRNEAFTKLQRRRLFTALEVLPSLPVRIRFLQTAEAISERSEATTFLAKMEYLKSLSTEGMISSFDLGSSDTTFTDSRGVKTTLIYADYLNWSESLRSKISQDRARGISELRIMGQASPLFVTNARNLGISVTQITQ